MDRVTCDLLSLKYYAQISLYILNLHRIIYKQASEILMSFAAKKYCVVTCFSHLVDETILIGANSNLYYLNYKMIRFEIWDK